MAVPFKGPALSQLLYSDVCSRSFGDLDILVSRIDLKGAIILLEQNGYELDTHLSVDYYLKLVDKHHHANLINKKNGVSVELHWEITGRYLPQKVELEFLRSRLDSVELNGVQLLNIGKEDLFVYLCVHGNRHCWAQLEFISCLAAYIRKFPDLNWSLTSKIAHQIGAERIVTLGLMLVEYCFGVSTTEMLRGRVKWKRLIKVKEDVERALLTEQKELNEEQLQANRLSFHYHTMDRRRDGLKYCFRKFCVPDVSDVSWLPLPRSLLFVYVIVRPIRFVGLLITFHLKSKIFKKGT